MELPAEAPATLEPEEVDFRVAFEDEHLLIVDKPAGIVVHPGAGHGSGTLVHGLVGRAGGGEADRPGIVHRLDRDTSGLLVVARSEEAYKRLQDLVQRAARWSATISRSSAAGRAPGAGGSRRRSAATETSRRGSRSTPTRRARPSLTSRSPSSSAGTRCWTCGSRPGRTHQIRVHLAAVDLPVIGDPVYGVPDQALGRQFLHAGPARVRTPVHQARGSRSNRRFRPSWTPISADCGAAARIQRPCNRPGGTVGWRCRCDSGSTRTPPADTALKPQEVPPCPS